MILLLLLLATNCGLSPQYLGAAGSSAEEEDSAGAAAPPLALPRHSLLPVDLHVVFGAGAHGDAGLLQEEGFEAHLHVFVVGHLRREMLLWAWLCAASLFPELGGNGGVLPTRPQGSEDTAGGIWKEDLPDSPAAAHTGVF